jgi:hypothetical protein
MCDASFSAWGTLLALGAFHGVNPGMGWLFAVALGMQERSRAAVWRAMAPLGLGHALAVGAAMAVALAIGLIIPIEALRWPVAILLLGFGVARLRRHKHPRWTSMRVGMGGLTLWSFLVATVHGAGLMVAPVYLSMAAPAGVHSHVAAAGAPAAAFTATAVHASGYLLVTAIIAVAVFEKFGLALLGKAWVNLDMVWAVALIVTGAVTLL